MAADVGLFGPESVTWRIHRDPAMLLGGLRSLIIQALHPLAMAGVDQHSDFRADPWGRFRRTAEYVVLTTFGDTATAEGLGAQVRAIHARVSGTDPHTGRAYRADDPELLAWVHNVEVHSMVTAYRRFAGRLTDAEADTYVAEMTRAAELVGLRPDDVPNDLATLRSVLREAELVVTPAARAGLRLILAPPMPLPLRPLWAIPGTAAVSILPSRVRAAYGMLWPGPVDPAVRVPVSVLFRSLRVLLPESPAVREALARTAAVEPSAA
jgi:uncharacterized protein (DUF2236 family)